LALVEDWPADSPLLMGDQEHPNGALQLVESVLCVPDADLSAYERRYARYLQRPARSDGPLRVFDLDASRVVIVPSAALGVILPDEVPPGAPGLRRLRVSRPRSFRYPDPSGTSRIPSPELASGRLLPAGQGSPRGSGHLSRCLMRPHSCHDRVAGTVVTRTIVAAPSGHQVRPSGHASPC
jgi:hypothetical protein